MDRGNKERVVVYALGLNWKKYKEQISDLFNIVACSDRNAEAAEYADGYQFILPDQISKILYDKIIIGCKQRGVRELIALEFHIPGDKIFYYDEVMGETKLVPINRKVEHGEKLTIVIPTYNRKERLKRTLDILEMQSDSYFDIIISDNHSDYDVSEIYADKSKEFQEKITLVRNRVNMGMGLNFANLFMQKSEGWIWTLSDDDIPSIYAVRDIYDEIERARDVGAINFSVLYFDLLLDKNTGRKDFDSMHALLAFYKHAMEYQNSMSLCCDFIFISNKVYNMNYARKYYKQILNYAYSMENHLVPILLMLNEGDARFRISNKKVVTNDMADNYRSNVINTIANTRTIVDLPLDLNETEVRMLYRLEVMHDIPFLIDCVHKENASYEIRQLEKVYYDVFQYIFSDEEKREYNEKMAELKKAMLES